MATMATGCTNGNEYSECLDDEAVCRLQAMIRSFLIRKKFREVRQLYEETFHELEGDSAQSTPSEIHWKLQNLCRPCIIPKSNKSTPRSIQGCHCPATGQENAPNLGHDTMKDVKVQATTVGSQVQTGTKPLNKGGKIREKPEDKDEVSVGYKEVISKKLQNEEAFQATCTPTANAKTVPEKVPAEMTTKESLRLSDSTSGSKNKQTECESSTSNAEYSSDFESYSPTSQETNLSSTKADQDPSMDGNKGTSLDFSVISQIGDHEISSSNGRLTEDAERADKDPGKLPTDEEIITPLGELKHSTHNSSCATEIAVLSDAKTSLPIEDSETCPNLADQSSTSARSDAETKDNSVPEPLQPLSHNHVKDDFRVNPHVEPLGTDTLGRVDTLESPTNVAPLPHLIKQTPLNELDKTSLIDQADKVDKERVCPDNKAARKNPLTSSTKIVGDHELSVAADMTSIWSNEASFSESGDYPTSVQELQKMRSNVAMELLWVQQAIGSRKNYLRLKSNMKSSGQNSNPDGILE